MNYVDGFLIPVPDVRKDEYRAHEATWWPFFQNRGAISLVVCWGDDVPAGKQTDFRRAVDLQEGETVVFAWIVYKSRAHRDRVNAAVMKDPELTAGCDPNKMPFDWKRMLVGGFETLVSS